MELCSDAQIWGSVSGKNGVAAAGRPPARTPHPRFHFVNKPSSPPCGSPLTTQVAATFCSISSMTVLLR